MSEIGEMYRALREDNRRKKKSNIAFSTELLKEKGIEFESKNNGVHLVVKHNGKIADFWPSTGKFNIRGEKQYLRGVKSLVNMLSR